MEVRETRIQVRLGAVVESDGRGAVETAVHNRRRKVAKLGAIVIHVNTRTSVAEGNAADDTAADAHVGGHAIPARWLDDEDRLRDLHGFELSALRQRASLIKCYSSGIDIVGAALDR